MKPLLCSLVAVMLLSSCYRLSTRLESDKPILLNTSPTLTGRVTPFRRTGYQPYAFWGLVGNHHQGLQQVLLEEVQKGRGLQNVKIKIEQGVPDLLLGILTLGIYQTRSFVITGEIVE